MREVQVEHIRLTPRVESVRFQIISTYLSNHWFQMSACTPPYIVAAREEDSLLERFHRRHLEEVQAHAQGKAVQQVDIRLTLG